MKLTFIDTPSHGYLKIHKNYFVTCGFDVKLISKYSGQDKNHVYLEEDCDASTFIKWEESRGEIVELEYVHRERNNVPSHNYDPNTVNPNNHMWL